YIGIILYLAGTKMKFKKLGRVLCTFALAGAAFAAATSMTGCSNGHAEAKITIEYDGISYVLDYTLYRNMYPQTVQHFIELADNRFYDNTIIHDYQTSYWYGGGYNYAEGDVDEGELSYKQSYSEGTEGLLDYLESTSKEMEYEKLANEGKLTPSVYRSINGVEGKLENPYNTLIGEFSSNNHKIENGALTNSYGALRFCYHNISDDKVGKTHVYLDKQGSPFGVMGEYRYNRATSLFSIQTGTSTSTDSSHCVFGTLNNTQTLRDLRTAVTKSYDYENVNVYVENRDEILGSNKNEATYRVTKTAIIVKSVRITKY
ncbi:MAG: peptidylprolyl isomerase, partial [Clostridia bacterium]|nr:peptidylprolyl isomerase [Clostridia bacterium]